MKKSVAVAVLSVVCVAGCSSEGSSSSRSDGEGSGNFSAEEVRAFTLDQPACQEAPEGSDCRKVKASLARYAEDYAHAETDEGIFKRIWNDIKEGAAPHKAAAKEECNDMGYTDDFRGPVCRYLVGSGIKKHLKKLVEEPHRIPRRL
ncbi:hypothetical protein ABZ929_05695 [Streptomyces physcomitrii]|uniref:hypothetical protein n=1 Tax=Streptomyces physcomitrii TaxID=2724184 RepID=UPI0033EED5CB